MATPIHRISVRNGGTTPPKARPAQASVVPRFRRRAGDHRFSGLRRLQPGPESIDRCRGARNPPGSPRATIPSCAKQDDEITLRLRAFRKTWSNWTPAQAWTAYRYPRPRDLLRPCCGDHRPLLRLYLRRVLCVSRMSPAVSTNDDAVCKTEFTGIVHAHSIHRANRPRSDLLR